MTLDTLVPTGLRDGTFKRAVHDADAVCADATFRAWCKADGVIFYGTETPSGAIELVRGAEELVRERLEIVARHGYEDGLLLVPGVPEAKDQVSAHVGLTEWLNWCSRCETEAVVWNVKAKVTL